MAELKPCPFCGGEAVLHEGEYSSKLSQYKKEIPKGARMIRSTKYPSGKIWYEYRVKAYIPQCSVTGCLGRVYKLFETEEEATEAWNRRCDDGKQIPKIPADIAKNELYGNCALCGKVVHIGMRYCDQCGQAIEWGEEDGK